MGNRLGKWLRNIRERNRKYAKTCYNCGYFRFQDAPPGRACKGPPIRDKTQILRSGKGCIFWYLEPNPENRIKAFVRVS